MRHVTDRPLYGLEGGRLRPNMIEWCLLISQLLAFGLQALSIHRVRRVLRWLHAYKHEQLYRYFLFETPQSDSTRLAVNPPLYDRYRCRAGH